MMKNNQITKNDVIAGGVILGFAATIIYAIDVTSKLSRISKKLDKTVAELIDTTEINVSAELVEASVVKAVDREVTAKVTDACRKAVQDVEKDINREVKDAVTLEFSRQKDDIKKEIKRQIGKIDISEVKQEVIEEAKEAAKEKFEDDLDSIVEEHNEKLESIARIYSSIADRIENA